MTTFSAKNLFTAQMLDMRIDRMMPELGFTPDDNDRLVASYRHALCASCSSKP